MKNVLIPEKEGNQRKVHRPYQKLTNSKIREKQEKGLCFRCDDRYFHGHKCKDKEKQELNLLIVNDEGLDDEVEEVEVQEEPKVKTLEVAENVEIALRSILGFPLREQ